MSQRRHTLRNNPERRTAMAPYIGADAEIDTASGTPIAFDVIHVHRSRIRLLPPCRPPGLSGPQVGSER